MANVIKIKRSAATTIPVTLAEGELAYSEKAGVKLLYIGTNGGADIETIGGKAVVDKVNGIEAGATADQTGSEILTALLSVDGTGSGLDADKLDGIEASSFSQTSHNHTLDGLSNTTISANSSGELLKWNGSAWINNTLAEAGIQPAGTYATGGGTATGTNTGDQTSVSGNAGTATKLATARTINGVSFDGSGNITVNAVDSTARIASSEKGAANGVCPLGADSLISSSYLPSYVDDVLEHANLAAFPATGAAGVIYVAVDTNKTYRWSGSAYVYITSGAVDSVAGKTGVVTLAKADVGLGSVDNTSDAAKPVSSATQTALNAKANTATTLAGYGITDAAASSHVGSGGTAHADATTSVDGFMTAADKTKLDGVASNANNYSHPTGAGSNHIPSGGATGQFLKYSASGVAVWAADNDTVYTHPSSDGSLHVPATGTSNNGKVLTAGATAGSLSWVTANNGTVTGVSGTAPIVSSGGTSPTISMAAATASVNGYATSTQIAKLDGIAAGAQVNVGTNISWTAGTTSGPTCNSSTGTDSAIPVASATNSGVVTTGTQTFAGVKTLTSPILVTPALGTPASGNLANCAFPTLNQNTTGSSGSCTGNAATATTAAACSGNAATATTAGACSGNAATVTNGLYTTSTIDGGSF